ncbi:MAG: 1,4-dihydroxy-2-naphthoate octaprenyltransferase [Gammaproteobacteria bacterium]|nr:MAG: 1,4-dihydroxy-2-naphthoate octaprenyltransferase [Gammaproteobacteria bacterium]RLA56494.1 MAG: 1,4-dihydroxy-2-naphthoate octaprenyltransferase [Gammaproteobacteria bacterium]HDY83365.1 prenyltransferase [Halieaceae bacterium]
MTPNFWRGFWRLADPKISLASFAGIFLGACMAAADQHLAWGWLALTVLGVFCVEVAKNASGEVVDYDSGTDLAVDAIDRSPFSGGKRVLVDELLTHNQTRTIAAVFFLTAIIIGLIIAGLRDWRVLVPGVIGIGLAWYYHGGTLRLSYHGLGEFAVALAYGPLVVCGTYFVQTGYLSAPLLHASLALGLLVAAFLWINEFPDYLADRQAGKRNLVVRLGRQRAALWYVVIPTAGYIWLVLTAVIYPGARGLLWGLLGVAPAGFSAWRLLKSDGVTKKLIPAQVACLASFVLMATGAGLGFLLCH